GLCAVEEGGKGPRKKAAAGEGGKKKTLNDRGAAGKPPPQYWRDPPERAQPYPRRSDCALGPANQYGGDVALSDPLGAARLRRAGAKQDCARQTTRPAAADEHHRRHV